VALRLAGGHNLTNPPTAAQPFPNPARTRLNISYALPGHAGGDSPRRAGTRRNPVQSPTTRVSAKLYDIAGKLVTTFANGDQQPGYYNLSWNRLGAQGRSVPAGVCFCALAAEGQRFSRKVVLTEWPRVCRFTCQGPPGLGWAALGFVERGGGWSVVSSRIKTEGLEAMDAEMADFAQPARQPTGLQSAALASCLS